MDSGRSDDTSPSPEILEGCASEIVECVKSLIDVLRTEFATTVEPLQTAGTNADSKSTIPLFSRLKGLGYIGRLERTLQKQADQIGSCGRYLRNGDEGSNDRDQRQRLVFEILLPLISALTECYRRLDELPEVVPKPVDKAHRGNKKHEKPPPPRGMLSIQNYTDVACLLEFTVCTSIIPQLEPGVLISLEDRLRYHLPKSLAGRIPKASLIWACPQVTRIVDVDKARRELVQSASVMTDLILLDRFRPMLLPRHLADIHAALFQAEYFIIADNPQYKQQLKQHREQYHVLYAKLGIVNNSQSGNTSLLDATLQAKSYQTLLLQGTKGPTWVRQRVSPLLTDLACENLAAVVQVFVPISEPASASQRLGYALAASSQSKPGRLVPQIMYLLQNIFPAKGEISGRSMAILHTIWAVLRHFPSSVVKRELFAVWERSLTLANGSNNNEERSQHDTHATVRQIGGLTSFCPPSSGAVLQWFLPSHSKVFESLLRLASMKTVLASSAKEDARQTLYWISKAMAAGNGAKLDGPSILAVTWVHALAPSPSWDLQGYKYYLGASTSASSNQNVVLEQVELRQEHGGEHDVGSIIDQTTVRVTTFMEVLLNSITHQAESNDGSSLSALPSKMFQLLLRIYLSSTMAQKADDFYQVVAIVLLPILCEQCSPQALLFGHETDLLNLIKLVLVCARSSLGNDMESDVANTEAAKDCIMLQSLGQIQKALSQNSMATEDTAWLPGGDSSGRNETMVAIASIVLSLLIAILELGSKLRSEEEENILQSYLPILSPMAQISVITTASNETEAGLADMSSYAMALIASRQAPKDETQRGSSQGSSEASRLKEVVDQAEEDLRSTQPPIRARGMVSLGRIARAYAGALPKKTMPLVVEVDQQGAQEGSAAASLVLEVLRLSIIGLSDSESYVYLAAIQTIVAIGDMRPKEIILVVAASVSSGTLRPKGRTEDPLATTIQLSDEQRIKLAEALMFIIRRRPATFSFVAEIINLMIYGTTGGRIGDHSGAPIDAAQASKLQDETRNYFRHTEEDAELENKQKWEEQDIRLKTGGPIFEMEEADVVRGARVSVVAELVSTSTPSSIAPHCRLLVRLVIDVLRHETSRVVCRAASMLARELYGCLLREQDELSEMTNNVHSGDELPLPLAVAMVTSNEELLVSMLEECVCNQGGDVNDPAVASRCEEAVLLRKQTHDEGIFAAAELVLTQRRSGQVPTLLRSIRKNNGGIVEIDKIGSLGN